MKAFCPENVTKFFQNLDIVASTTKFDPGNICNVDETGFSTIPSKIGKIICSRGIRRVGQIASAESGTMVTMALAVNATGNSILSFFLFPRKNMQSTFLDNASHGAVGYANSSGWMAQPEFVLVMRHFMQHSKSSKESPVLLLLDNHASHLSVEALDLAAANGVTLLSFPPHCSHKMQPLDVSVYGPVKTYYKFQCTACLKNNALKVLEIRHITGLVAETLKLSLSQKNITAGFLKTGIFPYNPNRFSDHDFVEASKSDDNAAEATLENELGEEDHRRIMNANIPNVAAIEKLLISGATTPTISVASSSRDTSFAAVLSDIGPLQAVTPKKPSNRGRKPMQSSILTSPENIAALEEKKRVQSPKKDASKKATSKKSTSKKTASKRAASMSPVTPPLKRIKKVDAKKRVYIR